MDEKQIEAMKAQNETFRTELAQRDAKISEIERSLAAMGRTLAAEQSGRAKAEKRLAGARADLAALVGSLNSATLELLKKHGA